MALIRRLSFGDVKTLYFITYDISYKIKKDYNLPEVEAYHHQYCKTEKYRKPVGPISVTMTRSQHSNDSVDCILYRYIYTYIYIGYHIGSTFKHLKTL